MYIYPEIKTKHFTLSGCDEAPHRFAVSNIYPVAEYACRVGWFQPNRFGNKQGFILTWFYQAKDGHWYHRKWHFTTRKAMFKSIIRRMS